MISTIERAVLALGARSDGTFRDATGEAGGWTLFDPRWHRLSTATTTSEQARKFLLWGARGDVLRGREAVPRRGSQVRGWLTGTTRASYLLGRPYWVWTLCGRYKLLLREPNVCRVAVSRLVEVDAAKLAVAALTIMACDECKPGAPKPFCMNCSRDLAAPLPIAIGRRSGPTVAMPVNRRVEP